MDHDEKKMRRQIANSNERRRMQSINAGFQSLRQLLPHHEGEKLSKAAILQQTAEYIDRLELEKQQLMTSNQHLQRLADLNGGTNNNNNNNTDCPTQQQQQTAQMQQNITSSPTTAVKKRKLDQVMTVQTISDSSDEGLGSMSPDPTFDNGTNTKTQMVSAASVTTVTVKDYVNLQNQMETERRHRIQLEEQLKQLESQFYSSERVLQYHNPQKYHTFHHQEVIEHTNNMQHDDVDEVDGGGDHPMEQKIIMRGSGPIIQDTDCHYSTIESMAQFVIVNTPGSSPKHHMMGVDDDDNSRTLSSDELHKDDNKMVRVTEFKESPKHHQQHHLQQQQQQQIVKARLRIPSILEQAIKAEPKVEVERINNSPSTLSVQINENAVQSPPRNNSPVTVMTITRNNSHMRTTYPCNSSRPNLETIVEAIRHLEGDVLFEMDGDDNNSSATKRSYSPTQPQPQDVPLALTTNNNKYHDSNTNIIGGDVDEEEDEDHPFLKFRTSAPSHAASLPTFSISVPQKSLQQTTMHIQQQQQQQQCYRPGVIVVKQSS
ncbi:unnamed protein product [Diamesa serratosioi]